MMVNNNAAAVLLTVSALAGDRPTAISRGHLVEIGGGFRLPTILEASGSPLMEIGTTNRTHLVDYEEAHLVAQVEQVGVHDDFFELGGHSLLATRVVLRVRQEYNVDLQLRHFLNTPTIAELANGLEGLLWINAGRPGAHETDQQEREEGAV